MQELLEQATVRVLDRERTNAYIDLPSFEEITPEESRQLRYTYRDAALARNSDAIGKQDSTSIFLSKDLFLYLLEQLPKTEMGSEGVLVHWAAYPLEHPDQALAGRHTIVIEIGDGKWITSGIVCPPVCPGGYTVCHPPPPFPL
jgi:hypothetical protein